MLERDNGEIWFDDYYKAYQYCSEHSICFCDIQTTTAHLNSSFQRWFVVDTLSNLRTLI